jgi:hypothetical protein
VHDGADPPGGPVADVIARAADALVSRAYGDVAYAPRAGGARFARWAGMVLLFVGASLLAIAAWLRPDPRGYGTHQQFGAAPCGMLLVTGLPCPTCGMTTAFAYTVRGYWPQAAWAQPAGFVLALATIAATGLGAWMLVRGRWPAWQPYPNTSLRLFIGMLVLLIGGWFFKIAAGLTDGSLPVRVQRIS